MCSEVGPFTGPRSLSFVFLFLLRDTKDRKVPPPFPQKESHLLIHFSIKKKFCTDIGVEFYVIRDLITSGLLFL